VHLQAALAVGQRDRVGRRLEARASAPCDDAQVAAASIPGRTILIVDDHPSFLAAARFLLETEGFEIVGVAADGESAVREALRSSPEIVLLDVSLPDMDGFEVAARLRAAGASSTIVFTSSREKSDFGSLIVDSGGAGFITKAELSGESLRALVA
jgi:DNA-binding NarL/FixJ family response regulator